jgi:hypothetical protein
MSVRKTIARIARRFQTIFLRKMGADFAAAETRYNPVKQILITDQQRAKESEVEGQRLGQRATELERQLADLKAEEAASCASVRSALDEVQSTRVSSSTSFRMSDSINGVETLEGEHANVVKSKTKSSLNDERSTVKRHKVVEQHQSLLALMRQNKDKVMQLHRSIFTQRGSA